MKRLIPLFLTLLISSVSGQQTFTNEPEKFVSQLEKYLGSYDKRDAKSFIVEFTPVWMTISPGEQKAIVDVCNEIAKQRIRIYPEFKGYVKAVHEIYKQDMGTDVFVNWNNVVVEVLKVKRKKEKADVLTNSGTFFEKGSFFVNQKVEWNIKGGSFKWGFKKGDAFLEFENVKLACYVNDDSTVLHNTGGVFDFPTKKFHGAGGTLYWTRTGLDHESTYATFETEYDINMKTASYRLDSVQFTTTYFDKPLWGSVSEKVIKISSNREPNYPVFDSYSKRLVITELIPGVDYDGGFTMKGATFKGAGTPEEPAKLLFKHADGETFAVSQAIDYQIKAGRILSEKAAAMVFISNDTISHPGLYLTCVSAPDDSYSLVLRRGGVGVGQSPFINTHHELEMYAHAIKWNRGDTLVRLGPDNSAGGDDATDALFQSRDCFDQHVYHEVGNAYSVNPITVIGKHAIRFDQFDFSLSDLASAMGQTVNQFKPTLFSLNSYGFVTYDEFKDRVHINQKLFNYIDYVAERIDHDDVVLASNTYGGDNATLNLNTNELRIRGLRKVIFSRAKYTIAYPDITGSGKDRYSGDEIKWGEVSVFENRNVIFDGALVVGSTEYFGRHFNFDYEKFKIELPACDSMRLRVLPFEGGGGQVRLVSVIEGMTGAVDIDDPSNRSGRDTLFRHYPILHSTSESFVYYNKYHGGAYPKETFRFIIEPFELDSLIIIDKDLFHLKGVFQSAGIFPDFSENLIVMRDYSLGFIKDSPPGGMGIYSDRGNFKNQITLTAKGLQGEGEIEFLTSSSSSTEWTFFPDSTVGIAENFTNVAQASPMEVPSVVGTNVKVNYSVKTNSLRAYSYERNLLDFFDGEARLKGYLSLTSEGMTGRGRMLFEKAQIAARKYSYKERQILSDTAAFYLRSIEEGQIGTDLPFKTRNVNAKVDFDERMGLFKSNGDSSYVEFPDYQYICYMDEMKWYMDDDDVEMRKNRPLTIEATSFEKPNFISVHPKQDSLAYMVPKARFDIKAKKITCTEVAYIDVADVRIAPDSGKVIVRKKAKIETLENAEIIANIITQNHRIVDATVDIYAKKSYLASGNYFYVDADKNETKFRFEKIEPDTSYTTYAEGRIAPEEQFKLNKYFEFRGKVELYAINPSLIFDGSARMTKSCGGLDKNWLNFREQIDPMAIYIPIEENKISVSGSTLGAGMMINTHPDSLGLYPVFLSKKGSDEYKEMIVASGFLYYDESASEYRIASKDKLQERSVPGNYVSLNTNNCVIEGDGNIGFGSSTGQVKTNAIGVFSYNVENKALSMQSVVSVDFPFVDKALGKMFDKMEKNEQLLPMEIGKTFYTKALKETFDLEKAEKIEADITLGNGIGKFPDELLKTFYFADVRFKWDKENTAFVSTGLIGVANLKKDQLFKYVTGKIVIEKERRNSNGRSRDKVKIYLEADEGNWYYFEYSNNDLGRMEVSSSDKEFISILSETNEDKLEYKGEKGAEDYQILVSTSSKKRVLFLDRYE